MAAYTDRLEGALEIEKKARYELQQTCMSSRQSKTLLKNGIRQRDVEVQQLRTEVRQKDAEIGQAREEILRYKRAISKPSKVNNQTSDTSIQADMDALFCSIRD